MTLGNCFQSGFVDFINDPGKVRVNRRHFFDSESRKLNQEHFFDLFEVVHHCQYPPTVLRRIGGMRSLEAGKHA